MDVRFMFDPNDVQNGSCPDFPDNIQDITMQGHRRSLAEWLKICGKTYAEWKALRMKGYGVKQSLVYGLPYTPPPERSRASLLFSSTAPYRNPKLSGMDLRVSRLAANFARFTKLPARIQRLWAKRVLTEGYSCWVRQQKWAPSAISWYPHLEVLQPTPAEFEDIEGWQHLGHYLEGSLAEGFWPTARLERHFGPIHDRKKGLVDWYPLISAIDDVAMEDRLTVVDLCHKIEVHRQTLYRSWKAKGIPIVAREGYTLRQWLDLALKADLTQTHRRRRLGAQMNRR